MCGIAGFLEFSGQNRRRREILQSMCDSIRHRGPDERGYHFTDQAALGHCRLSIIDLAAGRQPMFNEDGSIAVVFNGEIYDFREHREKLLAQGHRFTTESDTEVIVHLYEQYGQKCLDYLDGMFAFAIWDDRRKTLFAARDRIGQKPFYYAFSKDHFIFASELKAILMHPAISRRLDLASLTQYLVYEYIPAPRTIFQDIHKLEPAGFLTARQGKLKTGRYWDFSIGNPVDFSLNECEQHMEALLLQSVKRRLISDVPLGVFLSGGIDSSCIVALMAELLPAKNIHTFSVGFSENSFDESHHAKKVAKHFNTTHHSETLSPQTMLEIFPKVVDFLDEPLGDASIIPTYLLSRFTRKHVTVALGGDGGDELLAGYPTFIAHALARYYNLLPRSLRQSLIEPLVQKLPVSLKNISFDFKVKRFLSAVELDPYTRQQEWLGSFTRRELPGLLRPEIHESCNISKVYHPIEKHLQNLDRGEELEKILYVYTKMYLQDDILVKVDRASMANALEVRAPFLDRELFEFAARIPVKWKLHGLNSKYLLKRMLRRKLPKSIINRPKKGFGIPVARWLKQELKPFVSDLLAHDKIQREGLFCPDCIDRLLNEHFHGKKDNRKQLWTLIIFEMWLARYKAIP